MARKRCWDLRWQRLSEGRYESIGGRFLVLYYEGKAKETSRNGRFRTYSVWQLNCVLADGKWEPITECLTLREAKVEALHFHKILYPKGN